MALIRHLRVDQEATEVIVISLLSGDIARHFVVGGQLSSAVPVGDAVIAARGFKLERYGEGRREIVALSPGHPYMLRPYPALQAGV